LYHKYAPSNSKAYSHNVPQADVNTTTDIFTTTGTIPTTGSIIVNTSGIVGGISKGVIYYVIRLSSTTFKLATTKNNADAGVWIDITSADANNYFFMYDLLDYGISEMGTAGAIGLWGTSNLAYRDIIFGARLYDTGLDNQFTLCSTVPLLENRGYLVTPRIFLNSMTEAIQGLYVKHENLDTYDAILVKSKTKTFIGLPTSSPNASSSDELTWTSSTTATTTSDLSDAKTVFDTGEELEIELTAGIGAGQMMKITGLTVLSGTYTLTVEDVVIGYGSGLKSYFTIDNWTFEKSVTATSQIDGILEVDISKMGRAPQLKIELRGYQTTVEEIGIITNKNT
jgi:hypothetical protein